MVDIKLGFGVLRYGFGFKVFNNLIVWEILSL